MTQSENERMQERFKEFFTQMMAENSSSSEPEGSLFNPLSIFFSMDEGKWTSSYDCQAALCVMVAKGTDEGNGKETGTAQLLLAGKPRLRDMLELKKFLYKTAIPQLNNAIAEAGGIPSSLLGVLDDLARGSD